MRILTTVLLFVLTLPGFSKQTFSIERWKTSNGTQVVFYPAMNIPMLDISIAFKAGSAYDDNQFGISALTSTLLNQGNSGLNADKVAERLAETGAQYNADSSRDAAVFSLRTLSREDALKSAIHLFSSIIAHPDFPKEAFIREKKQQLMMIAHTKESPSSIATQMFFETLYKAHPYAHPTIGDKTHVEAIERKQLLDFYHRYYVGKNATLVLVGAISKQTAQRLAEEITHDLPAGKEPPPIKQASFAKKQQKLKQAFPSSQTVFRIGQLGITYDDNDYFPLLVGNYILGGDPLNSDLAAELREKRGLTYGVYSQFIPMPGIGPFLIYFSTKNSEAATAGKLTHRTLTSFLDHPPSMKTLAKAKQYLTGNFQLSLASNRSMSAILLKMALYHLPDNYLDTYLKKIKHVTAEEIQSAFKKHITPNQLLQIEVGKA